MWSFRKSATDSILEIINLTIKANQQLKEGKTKEAEEVLKIILRLNDVECQRIEDETGSNALLVACNKIRDLSRVALDAIETQNGVEKAEGVLIEIISLEQNDVLVMAKRYQELKAELKKRKLDIDRLADRQGKGMDVLIKPLVAVLNYFGLKTEQSCEGHLDRGQPYPQVRFQANKNFNELIKIVEAYNSRPSKYKLVPSITWHFQQVANSGDFTSSLDISKPNRDELTKAEIDFLVNFCKDIITKHNLQLFCGNQKNYWITLLPKEGLFHEDLKRAFLLIKALEAQGYEVTLNLQQEKGEPDAYNLLAKGGSLKRMQQDILLFSDYIAKNFKL